MLIRLPGFLHFIPSVQERNIIYVDTAATGANNGNSWVDAYTCFQAGVDAASAGDSVFVAAGTYRPATGDFFSMKKGVKIYGGFTGSETSLDQRAPVERVQRASILAGNGNGVIRNEDNGLDNTALLDGFIITGGNALSGGGMYNFYVSPTISHCTFSDNTASAVGGGVYNFASSPVISHCIFSGNKAQAGGGLLNHDYSSPIISHCIFLRSTAVIGGAVFNQSSCPAISYCTFIENAAQNQGGGIYNANASPVLTQVTLGRNTAKYGGGVYNEYASPVISHCIIYGNSEGIYNHNSTSTVTCSIVQEDYTDTGNMDADLLFSAISRLLRA